MVVHMLSVSDLRAGVLVSDRILQENSMHVPWLQHKPKKQRGGFYNLGTRVRGSSTLHYVCAQLSTRARQHFAADPSAQECADPRSRLGSEGLVQRICHDALGCKPNAMLAAPALHNSGILHQPSSAMWRPRPAPQAAKNFLLASQRLLLRCTHPHAAQVRVASLRFQTTARISLSPAIFAAEIRT